MPAVLSSRWNREFIHLEPVSNFLRPERNAAEVWGRGAVHDRTPQRSGVEGVEGWREAWCSVRQSAPSIGKNLQHSFDRHLNPQSAWRSGLLVVNRARMATEIRIGRESH